ncbi:Os02g0510400, partial [Oryza sativa Japonica Group]
TASHRGSPACCRRNRRSFRGRRIPFEIDLPVVPFGASWGARAGKEFFPAAAVASVIDIGRRLGQAGVEIGASVVNASFKKWFSNRRAS